MNEGAGADSVARPLARAAGVAFLVLLVALPWMRNGVEIRGLYAYPVDFLFLVTMALWAGAILAGQTRLRLHPSFVLLALYFAAMAVSALFSAEPRTSAFKLLTEIYLLMLPVLAFNLVRTEAELKRAMSWWLAAAVAVGIYGLVTVLLFPFFGYDSFLSVPLHHFGTLPPGRYPRIELTFVYPSMLANYLGVSLMFLLIGHQLGWIGRAATVAASIAIAVSILFALTPGIGGILAMLFVWAWYLVRDRKPAAARLAVAAAAGLTLLELLVAAVTPILHPTAPFLIHLPGIAHPLAPAVRLMVWIAAARNFASSPIVGHGIGVDAVSVLYQMPESDAPGAVTDAHQFILNIGCECGILGIAALLAIVWFVFRQARASGRDRSNPLLFGLSIAWLSAFAVQGLVGSFEDSRPLWILLGFIASASSLRPREA
jgi:O-antigen ligase